MNMMIIVRPVKDMVRIKQIRRNTFDKLLLTKSDLDKKPAERKDPIKDTPSLKTPITGSYLGKRLRQSESGPTDMNPLVREPRTITESPFNP